jgi:hypothetical protein
MTIEPLKETHRNRNRSAAASLAGMPGFVQRQSGNRENTQFHGTNTVCVRLAKPSAPEMFDD